MSLRVVTVRELTVTTPRTRRIRLDLGDAPFAFHAGQAVMVGLHGSPLRKPYSIASSPIEAARTRQIELLIQVETGASLDPHLELATIGTPLDLEGPFGRFALPDPLAASAFLFVAGGTGIAPLRSMLMERLDTPPPAAIAVVCSARLPEELAYRAELDALAGAGRIRLFLTVTRHAATQWAGRQGRIDAALLDAALPSREACCIICGPPDLERDVRTRLLALGVPAERILLERFDA